MKIENKKQLSEADFKLLSTFKTVSGGLPSRRCAGTIEVTINCTSDKDVGNCEAAGIK